MKYGDGGGVLGDFAMCRGVLMWFLRGVFGALGVRSVACFSRSAPNPS